MLYLEEYQPHFMAFRKARAALVNQALSEDEFARHVDAFQSFLEHLASRVEWESPLLGGFSRGEQLEETLLPALASLRGALAVEFESEESGGSLNRLEQCLDEFVFLQSQLPAFTDISVLNELLILGTQLSRGEAKTGAAMAARLPHALEWLADRQAEWSMFGRLHPARAALAAEALRALSAIKGGLGAIHLELSGEAPGEAGQGLQLLVKALEALGPVEETRHLVDSQAVLLSGDLRLERAARIVEQTGSLPPSHRGGVNRFLVEFAARADSLGLWLAVSPPSGDQERGALAGLRSELASLSRAFIEAPPSAGAEQLKPVLRRLEAWRVSFEGLSLRLLPQRLSQPA